MESCYLQGNCVVTFLIDGWIYFWSVPWFCTLTFANLWPNNRHTKKNIYREDGATRTSCTPINRGRASTHCVSIGEQLWSGRWKHCVIRGEEGGSGCVTHHGSRVGEWGSGRGEWEWWECFWEDAKRCRSVC